MRANEERKKQEEEANRNREKEQQRQEEERRKEEKQKEDEKREDERRREEKKREEQKRKNEEDQKRKEEEAKKEREAKDKELPSKVPRQTQQLISETERKIALEQAKQLVNSSHQLSNETILLIALFRSQCYIGTRSTGTRKKSEVG